MLFFFFIYLLHVYQISHNLLVFSIVSFIYFHSTLLLFLFNGLLFFSISFTFHSLALYLLHSYFFIKFSFIYFISYFSCITSIISHFSFTISSIIPSLSNVLLYFSFINLISFLFISITSHFSFVISFMSLTS